MALATHLERLKSLDEENNAGHYMVFVLKYLWLAIIVMI